MEDPYRTIRLKRELLDRAERVLLEHPDLGITSLASLVAGALVRHLDTIERPSQPAPVSREQTSSDDRSAQSSHHDSARNARGGQPAKAAIVDASRDVVLDEKRIARFVRARLEPGRIPQAGLAGKTPRELGLVLTAQAAEEQGFSLGDSDLEKLYERIVQERKL